MSWKPSWLTIRGVRRILKMLCNKCSNKLLPWKAKGISYSRAMKAN